MQHEQYILHIDPESELSKCLKAAVADGKPLRLISGEAIYDVAVAEHALPQDIWCAYDLDQTRQALTQSAGALTGVDRVALRSDIRDARAQNSHGRPR